MKIIPIVTALVAVMLIPSFAHAHLITEDSGFLAGLEHPVFGLDHFLAMLCVGIVSAQMGGKAIWTIPATFVIAMGVGGVIGFEQIELPLAEYIISFSVIALGLAIAVARKMPILMVMLFVVLFGAFHGYAHGFEMPVLAKALPYATGFISSTASIHIAGVIIGVIAKRLKNGLILLRFAGAIIAGMGLEMVIIMKELC